jgi:hypothetical protein
MAEGKTRKRRGLKFVVKAIVLGAAVLAVVVVAGDDETRASLRNKIGV